MKRVAICMRGAISRIDSKFFSTGDYNRLGEYIDYTKCYNSIVRHILQPNEKNYSFDFFCHCWNEELQTEILQLYNPVSSLFENNNVYKDEIKAKVIIPHIFDNQPVSNDIQSEAIIYKDIANAVDREILEKVPFTDDYSGISQALTMKKSIELKEKYEFENKIEYDIVILYRYDVLLWKDLHLSTYNNLENTIYVNAYIDYHGESSNGDFHFIMNHDKSSKFKHLYDSACNGNKHKLHGWIKNYVINFMNLTLQIDDIYPGKDQEVFRKLEELSIHPGYLTQEQLNSYAHI
jgi:hypothetical protein